MLQLCVTKFQFHKGTIKTGQPTRFKEQLMEFQFHKGTIKTNRLVCCSTYKEISIP